jgi:hypothetical protein
VTGRGAARGPGPKRRHASVPPGYWLLAGLLIGFGLLGILSIGIPFLVLGLALALLAPARGAPDRFWPPLVGIASFFLGFVLIAPFRCIATAAGTTTSGGVASIRQAQTVCTSLVGLHFSGGAGYDPSRWPAVVVGLLALVGGWGLSRFLIIRFRGPTPPGPAITGGPSARPRKDPWRWLGAGAVLALSLIFWFLTIPVLLLGVALVLVLAVRRREGWPLILTGFGLATAPFTLRLWLAPECVNGFSDLRPGHQVTRCFERAPVEVWPALVSLGLVAIGLALFRRQRKRAASESPVG